LIIKHLTLGMLMTNCYILACEKTKEAVVIDPADSDEVDKILMTLAESKLKLKYIINTHGHFDHVSGNKRLKQATSAPILIHKLDAPMLPRLAIDAGIFGLSAENSPPADQFIDEGNFINFGEISLKVFHTPGHTQGGISLYTNHKAFVGDTLFMGSIGRTDFPGGNFDVLISSIKNKLFMLGDNVEIYSGHGPITNIKQEKRFNPFLT